ncbi:ABC transporter ATP-binding protein/permease [Corynebacterium nuruki]|uniref:ABC transporter ATP-binding protein/permease n=1 Tax=Corynebacterium nuruki TaxID=1032851 RepID=UPI0039BEFDF2
MTVAGPVDPRLLRLSPDARRWILLLAGVTAARTGCLVTAGVLTGTVAARVITGDGPGSALADETGPLVALGVLVVLRAVLAWAEKRYGRRAAGQATRDLRDRALRALAVTDPRQVDRPRWRTLLTEGVDGLGPYLTGYLPALVSTVIATPAVLVTVWWLDAGSALIAVVTLPLIPLFMWLVGTLTAGLTERKLEALGTLADQLLDLITGLPTLRALGRLRSPADEIRRLSDRHRTSTLAVLRIAFLSSFVLEFLATLSIALVAVGIGFRLLDGSMTLAAGLCVLIIVPEVYNPVRQVGARFHDARDGFVAVGEILTLLNSGTTAPDAAATPTVRPVHPLPADGVRVVFDRLSVDGRDGARPRDVTGTADPGALTVLTGANGSGKSTALLALLGIVTDGVHGTAVCLDRSGVLTGRELWDRTSYLPQRPVLDAASVGDTSGLSLGQRQRVAVADELESGRELVVLDEPTAHLDAANARLMVDRLRRCARAGATVVAASHDPLLTAAADRVIAVGTAEEVAS